MIEEGVIKFKCTLIKAEPLPLQRLQQINAWRQKLYILGLIGKYSNGVGYGNLSIRRGSTEQFIITGSGTGALPVLDGRHYTHVLYYDIEKNSLTCKGPLQASSESLTHAMLYHVDSTVNAVIHVHCLNAWKQLLNNLPTTAENISYGTPAMAHEIVRLFKETYVGEKKILVMGGHPEGIISFGKDLEEAGNVLLEYVTLANPVLHPKNGGSSTRSKFS